MNILILDMETPTCCGDCRFYVDKWCYATDNNGNVEPSDMPKWCPLIYIGENVGQLSLVESISSDNSITITRTIFVNDIPKFYEVTE